MAQMIGSLFVIIKFPTGVCNIIAGILYLLLSYVLLKLLAEKILKMDLKELGIPKFHIKSKWIVVAVILPIAVTIIYLFFPGEFGIESSVVALGGYMITILLTVRMIKKKR
ncbi:MAG: hypothetical protein PHW34_06130 [Hespellia sp.]|nr:hypothetical protein [Hespellia sp.]